MGASKLGVFISAARGGGIREVQQDDIPVSTGLVTILNFEGDGILVTDEGQGKVTVLFGNIITHELDQNHNPLQDGPLVVVDQNGDVVRSFV